MAEAHVLTVSSPNCWADVDWSCSLPKSRGRGYSPSNCGDRFYLFITLQQIIQLHPLDFPYVDDRPQGAPFPTLEIVNRSCRFSWGCVIKGMVWGVMANNYVRPPIAWSKCKPLRHQSASLMRAGRKFGEMPFHHQSAGGARVITTGVCVTLLFCVPDMRELSQVSESRTMIQHKSRSKV